VTSLGAVVHPTAIVGPNVQLGRGSVIEAFVVLGTPPRGKTAEDSPLVIGPGAVVRAHSTIYGGTTIGARLQTGHGAVIREDNVLGDDVSVGTGASLEFGNRIGLICEEVAALVATFPPTADVLHGITEITPDSSRRTSDSWQWSNRA